MDAQEAEMAAQDPAADGAPKKKVNPLMKVYNAMPAIGSRFGPGHRISPIFIFAYF